jgi:nitrous oxide reductase accessory protein NosL
MTERRRHSWKHAKGSSPLCPLHLWHRTCQLCGLHERYRKGPKGGMQVAYQDPSEPPTCTTAFLPPCRPPQPHNTAAPHDVTCDYD